MMLLNVMIASALMVITTAIHASSMLLTVQVLVPANAHIKYHKRQKHLLAVAGVVLVLFLVSVIEVLIWSLTYLWLGALEHFEEAAYFSMVTFTTLGYGDIVLTDQWRLLASFEAANGIIMFGWTTAIVLAVVQRLYFNVKPS
ncbi:MAG TPA: ion channel [Gammaproteobacteria bacterium]|nr:ion channel [Gammaproteobacteria bacterium]